MRTLRKQRKDHLTRKMFFDGEVDIARYDVVKYPQIEKITDRQLGFFWRPEEVDILRDANDFDQLTEQEQHIFTSNLKRQIVLDSVQGRAPNLAFLPLVSLPELETWIETWSFYETIHSRSYTHIIRNVYPNPDDVFDNIMNIKPIVECGQDISKYYDQLLDYTIGSAYGNYGHKKALWLALNAELLKQYVEWIACKRMKAIMIPCPYDVPAANPLPWTQKWIAGGSVQVAPQETEISSYVVGGVKKDVQEDTFKGLSL